MIALKQILLPTDFSRSTEPAVAMASLLVEQFEAHLHLLHVEESLVDRLPDFGMGMDFQPLRQALSRSQEQREADVLAKLSAVLDADWRQDKQTTLAIRAGKPFVEIVRYAREHETDLIVMGTHGHTGLSHAMLGGVTESVVRLAPCPVLTVRATEHTFQMP